MDDEHEFRYVPSGVLDIIVTGALALMLFGTDAALELRHERPQDEPSVTESHTCVNVPDGETRSGDGGPEPGAATLRGQVAHAPFRMRRGRLRGGRRRA